MMRYGKAMRYKIPELRPAASVEPAAWPDSTVALHIAHCAHDDTDSPQPIRTITRFLIADSTVP
jgi:hypothetical protein